MKKFLTFIALLCTAAVASNEPAIIIVSGPSYIAASSYGVKYHIGVGGHLNGDRRGYNWEVRDENNNQVNDWIVSRHDEQNARINIISNCTIYATLYYEEWDTGINKSLHTSYAVTTGTPTFYLEHADSIHNGQFDTTITGVTTRVIHFNIDRDEEGDQSDIYKPDYQINGDKHFLEDDDILTFRINSSPSYMNVEYIKLIIEAPHLRVCRIFPGSSSVCVPITTTGSSTVYCGDTPNLGRIFNRNLYLEGMRIRTSSLKIKYVLDNGYSTTIADLRYRTCADIAGRQELYQGDHDDFQDARSLSLTGCEFSLYDNHNLSDIVPPFFSVGNDYNAPALAVDSYWSVIGTPFKVAEDGYGSPGNQFVLSNNCWYTSYEAFGGSIAFYESSLWNPKLFRCYVLNEATVINYEGLNTGLKSLYYPGACPGWKMFYMKLTDLSEWDSDAILHHRGEVLYQHYYDVNSSNNGTDWLPIMYNQGPL